MPPSISDPTARKELLGMRKGGKTQPYVKTPLLDEHLKLEIQHDAWAASICWKKNKDAIW